MKNKQVKPNVISGKFECQLFPVVYEFYIGEQDDIEQTFLDNNPHMDISGISDTYAATLIPMLDQKPRKCAFLFVKGRFNFLSIAHETLHAVFHVFRFCSATSDGSHNEPEAYYQGWLIKKIFEGAKADPSRMMVIG